MLNVQVIGRFHISSNADTAEVANSMIPFTKQVKLHKACDNEMDAQHLALISVRVRILLHSLHAAPFSRAFLVSQP